MPLNPWKLSGYKPGQNVVCKVTQPEPGGYAVIIPKDGLPGFLPTQAMLRSGEEILAQFVCVHNHRVLLSARFSNTIVKATNAPAVRWEEHLNEIGEVPGSPEEVAPQAAQQAAQYGAPPTNGDQNADMYRNNYEASQVRTVPSPPAPGQQQQIAAAPQFSAESEAEAAFNVWAPQTVPRKFHLRRAIDLILPPIPPEEMNEFKIEDYDLEWLITDLAGGMRTGCVKASSESKLSRSAMLLYRGRVVGCIYGCKTMPETPPTEQSLQYMLSDLERPDTAVKMYDLPENVTLPMSALFLGIPVTRDDNYDARSYIDYMCQWFEQKSQTACLAISLPGSAATCLGFIYKGQFAGAFYVENQEFRTEKEFVYELLRNDPKAGVEASILPPEMTSSAVAFGFSLTTMRKRNHS